MTAVFRALPLNYRDGADLNPLVQYGACIKSILQIAGVCASQLAAAALPIHIRITSYCSW